jgi:hypothetical protein
MEQGIGCSNHPDKNAIRLCDNCDMPFCAECLRKNLLGFYYCHRCYPRFFRGIIIGFSVFLFNFFIISMQFSEMDFSSGLERTILSAIITYFLVGLCCGKFWPENPQRWGFWLTIPYGFMLILLIIYYVYVLVIMKIDSSRKAEAIFFSMTFIFVYFILFLISSFGAYVGSRLGKNV